jgi:hypothetical protein
MLVKNDAPPTGAVVSTMACSARAISSSSVETSVEQAASRETGRVARTAGKKLRKECPRIMVRDPSVCRAGQVGSDEARASGGRLESLVALMSVLTPGGLRI